MITKGTIVAEVTGMFSKRCLYVSECHEDGTYTLKLKSTDNYVGRFTEKEIRTNYLLPDEEEENKYTALENAILNEIHNFCSNDCGNCKCCIEEECILFRIESLITKEGKL